MHAMTGCETMSAMFGVGKTKAFKVMQASEKLSAKVLVFGDLTTPKYVLFEVGGKFLSALYGGSEGSLDALRCRQFISPKYVPLERMPPTTRAPYYHCLRVHLHVVTWCALRCPDEFGFKLENEALVPIITDEPPASSEMLRKSVVHASQPTVFAHHVPTSIIGCPAACTANAEDNVRTAALLPPMDANNESVRFGQQGNDN